MPQLLSQVEIDTAMPHLKGWSQRGKSIEKEFSLPDTDSALEFASAVGRRIENVQHEPVSLTHEENKVKVRLSSPATAGGLTDDDVKLAREIETLCRMGC